MYTVYGAYKNSDMTEGRGSYILDIAFEYEEDALKYINAQPGIMGRPAHPEKGWTEMGDWTVRPITVLRGISEVAEFNKTTLVRKALAKLSPEERAALNLNFDL